MKTVIIGIACIAFGLGAVIVADRAGWSGGAARQPVATVPGPRAAPADPAAALAPPHAAPAGSHDHVDEHAHDHEQDHAPASDAAATGARLLRPPSPTCTKDQSPIVLGHPAVVEQAGIAFAPARAAPAAETFQATGRIVFPTDRHARLGSRAAGVVTAVRVDLGQEVRAGDELLVVDSAELGSAKAALRQAAALASLWERNRSREQHLVEQGVGRQADLIEAETRLAEAQAVLDGARQKLRNLGLDEDAIRVAARGDDEDSRLPLRAPFDGVVVDLAAAPGESAATGTPLVTVADPRRVWALLDIPERELGRLRAGTRVAVQPQSGSDLQMEGPITWIAPRVDERTRTVTARVELDNGDGRLRAGQFITARVAVGGDERLVLVPRDAVQWDGCCNVVFVRGDGRNRFATRKVHVAHASGDEVALREGVEPGTEVVTTGSWLLKTEILKGSIGAGCCEVH